MASEAPKILCNIGISGAFFVFMKKNILLEIYGSPILQMN